MLGATHRVQTGQAFQRGLRAVALVAGQGDLLVGDFAGFLVLHFHGGGERYDLVVELARLLTGSHALLTDQGVLVLGLTADVVARSHDVGGFDHGQIQLGLVLFDPLVGAAEHVELVVLAQADGLDATGNDGRHLFADHALGSDSDGLQAGAAETVDRHAGGGHRQAAADGRQARHVLALGTFMEGRAEDHILNQCRIDTGTLYRFLDDETGQIDAVSVVQRAAVGFAQAGTGRGYDYCISHGSAPVFKHCARRRVSRMMTGHAVWSCRAPQAASVSRASR